MGLHDISVPIREGMPIYRGNPGFEIEPANSISGGDEANISKLTMGAHTGTHVDGPRHFLDGGPGTEALPLEAMLGRARVVAIPDRGTDPIDREALEAAAIPADVRRLLLRTTNSRLWELDAFSHEFTRLDASGAEFVIERGIELIGIDYLSIGDGDAHRALLGAGIVALEGLDLRQVEPGEYELSCLPLRLIGSDGAPCRAILRDLDTAQPTGRP